MKCENGSNRSIIKIQISLRGAQHCYLCLSVSTSPVAPSLPGSCDRKKGEGSIFDRQEGYGTKEKESGSKTNSLTSHFGFGQPCR